jgi:hypothetical protein
VAIRDVHYLPGASVCVVGPGVVFITDLAAASAVVTACWDALAAGQDADALVEIIRREVPTGSARVALAGTDGPAVRVLLGGAGAHAIVAPRGAPPIELQAPASSWFDEQYPDVGGVRLTVQPLGTEAQAASDIDGLLPMRVGVALASTAVLGAVDILRTPATADVNYRPQHGTHANEPVRPPMDPALAQPPPADNQEPDAARWLAPEAFGVGPDDGAGQSGELFVPIVEPTGVAPTVLAVSCPDGHLGPPYDELCRICGAPIPPQGPFSAPRPRLGTLELSSGVTIPLDRDVVLGRAPSAGAATPEENVQLVRVPSPNNDISRNHVRVSLEGWHVLVADLGSTNGTVVTVPGEEPVQLRPHDAITITAGTVVALADEIEMRYDPRG